MENMRPGIAEKDWIFGNSCAVEDSNPGLESESVDFADDGNEGSSAQVAKRNRKWSLIVCLGVLMIGLGVSGVFFFMLRQIAILRLETELLKLRIRDVENQVEHCNALHRKSDMLARAADGASADPQSPTMSLWNSQSHGAETEPSQPRSSSLSSPSTSSASLGSSSLRRSRLKRNAEKKNNKKNTKIKASKSQKEFAVNFETDQPLACKQSGCLSLTGWKPSSWVDSSLHRHFDELSGQLEIPTDGVYFIYAQVTYRTVAALEAFAIMIDSNHQLAKCMTGVDYVNPDRDFANNAQSKTCHTGAVVFLRREQKVWLKSFHMGNQIFVLSMKHTSFWGVVKM